MQHFLEFRPDALDLLEIVPSALARPRQRRRPALLARERRRRGIAQRRARRLARCPRRIAHPLADHLRLGCSHRRFRRRRLRDRGRHRDRGSRMHVSPMAASVPDIRGIRRQGLRRIVGRWPEVAAQDPGRDHEGDSAEHNPRRRLAKHPGDCIADHQARQNARAPADQRPEDLVPCTGLSAIRLASQAQHHSSLIFSCACGVSPSSASSRACSTQPSRVTRPWKPSRFSSTQATSSGVQAAIWSKW